MSNPQTPTADELKKTQTGAGTGEPNGGGQSGQSDTTDYKEKFTQSAKEAQRLLDEKKAQDAEIERLRAENIALKKPSTRQPVAGDSPHKPNPSAPDVESLTETVKSLTKAVAPILDRDRFNQEFDKFSKQTEYSLLKGKKAEFKKFCYEPENVETPTEILAARFCMKLAAQTKNTPNDEEPLGLEEGAGGDDVIPPADGYTDEQIAIMRKSDHRRYMQLAKEGKLRRKK